MTERNYITDKAMLRKEMADKRNSVSVEERKRWSNAACAKAAVLLESQSAASFMVYLSFRSELDLSALIEWGWRTGRDVIVPRCIAADRSMTLHLLQSWNELTPGVYGIMEPNPLMTPAIEKTIDLDFVFVPGLAFDRKGGRLGYGGGYYDRFAASKLKQAGDDARTKWIGAAFEDQVIEAVPLEEHDLAMHGLVTELDIYIVKDMFTK